MADMTDFFPYWRERIEKDLTPFTDPGTRLEITGEKRVFTAQWLARGASQQANFALSLEAGIQVTFHGAKIAYKSFLASPDLADLLGMAKMILQAQSPGLFVPTKARAGDEPEAAPGPALKLLQDLLDSASPDVTRIIMVTGEAGAGKTRVLQELVRDQALRYQRGQTDSLYLYINAQGRALARFNEALATELQDLRALLTYHAVSALVRLGILVPIIDGFDELLGIGGYDDAFSSLTGFIEELDGFGQMVASARSTYYEQEFVARASSVSALGAQAWTQVPIEVVPWGDTEFDDYVRLYAGAEHLSPDAASTLQTRVKEVFSGRNKSLGTKPLFVARTVNILQKDPDFSGGEDLLKELVFAYLDRERRDKLLDRHGGSLLTSAQMELLFKTLSEEMWNQETRELDRRSVREIAEYVLVSEGLSEAVQRVVVERMPQLAFLTPGERSGGISFEHEMFFSFFLSQVFRESLLKDATAIRVLLSRSVLPDEVARAAIESIHQTMPLSDHANCQQLLDSIAKAGEVETPRTSQIRENAGLIAGAILKVATGEGPAVGIRIWKVVVPGGDLAGVQLRDSRFDGVELRRVDLSKTRLEGCRADELLLSEIIVDPEATRLELAGIDVSSQIIGLRVRHHGLIRGVYDPNEVRRILVSCGTIPETSEDEVATTVRPVPATYMTLLERLARAYSRTNPICTHDDTRKALFRDSSWPELERLLLRHGVVTLETRATSGRRKPFLRRQYLPEEIMAGADRSAAVPTNVRAFWDELERVAEA
jgi:hypothetical protein